jgi:hypothetical protein
MSDGARILYEVASLKMGRRVTSHNLTEEGENLWQDFFRTGNAVITSQGRFFVPNSEKHLFNGRDYSKYENKYDVKVTNYRNAHLNNN